MATPILSTKLHIPAPPQALVPREHLISRLDGGTHGKLILVSAPAGFGKTSLLAEWVHRYRDDCLVSWVHLDAGDNEPARFLSYLIAALQVYNENLGEGALAGLGSIPPAPFDVILTSLVNEIDALEDRLILILDDYHLIDHPSIHNAIDFLLDHIPAHMCLVIATRVDPPLPLHRLRARGQMIETRAEDLRFSNKESRIFLENILQTQFADDDLLALDGRIEGWIAGLQMLALSIKGRKDASVFIRNFTGSHRYIVDFLTEEIFNQQPAHIQQFLLKTSLLERLSGPLCDAVLEMAIDGSGWENHPPPSQQILEQLEHANLFLLPLDEAREWYRYHRLFASVLQQRMRQTYPEEISGLLQRASAWHAENKTIDEAFQYALVGEDVQTAALLVENHALENLKLGAIPRLLGWLYKLPEKSITARPWLSVYMGWALLLSGNQEKLNHFLEAAESDQDNIQNSNDLRGHIASIRAYAAAIGGEVEKAFDLANLALGLLSEDNLTVRSVVSFTLGGINFMRGDIPAAIESMLKAGDSGERAGNIHLAVSALNAAGDMVLSQGNRAKSEQIFDHALKLGTGRSGRPLPIAAGVYSGLAEIYLDRNDLMQALQFAETGVDLAKQWGNPESLVSCYLALAHVSYREGDPVQARGALSEAKRVAATSTLSPGTGDRILAYETLIQEGTAKHIGKGVLVEPLTEREQEVLGLLAKGRSNPEIAAELIIALGTVKAHTSSIYRKLDVRGRTEAVIKASELELL